MRCVVSGRCGRKRSGKGVGEGETVDQLGCYMSVNYLSKSSSNSSLHQRHRCEGRRNKYPPYRSLRRLFLGKPVIISPDADIEGKEPLQGKRTRKGASGQSVKDREPR